MGIDIASQAFGSKEGHEINTTVDNLGEPVEEAVEKLVEDMATSEAATFLKNAGFPATLAGAGQYLLAEIEKAIPTGNATLAADLKAVLSTAFAAIEANIPAIDL